MTAFRPRPTHGLVLLLGLGATVWAHVVAAQPETPCDPAGRDCASAVPVPKQEDDARAKFPLIDDGKLSFSLRNFIDSQTIDGLIKRHAWTVNMQMDYESGYTSGAVGFGLDVSPFAALKVNSSDNAGNMIHVRPEGHGQDDRAWAYLGRYAIKARVDDTVLKYGLQQVSNPFLESKDNRGLPPTFRGVTLATKITPALNAEAGGFNAVQARGHSSLQPLTTNFGGTSFDRVAYAGANWEYSPAGSASVYVDQVSDVWSQSYFSLSHSLGDPAEVKWTGTANLYVTREQGAARQGTIDNKAYSLSLSATRGAFTGMVAYQKIASDQFFDYIGETWGIALANALVVDYAAPHEQSLQLRGVVDARTLGVPGLKLMVWGTAGRGADATASAGVHASASSALHDLYWKDGQPVHGSHRELGIYPSYVIQDGRFKGAKFAFFAVTHKSSPFYFDNGSREYKFTVDVPLKGF